MNLNIPERISLGVEGNIDGENIKYMEDGTTYTHFTYILEEKYWELEAELAAAQAECERLCERDETAKRLADYCRMTMEIGALDYGGTIAVAYRDYMALIEEQKEIAK